MTAKPDRLFVPLNATAFDWWRSGKKRWEVRRDAPRWSCRHVFPGRRVELRRGYSGPSLWGTVGRTIVRAALREMPRLAIPIEEVAPGLPHWFALAGFIDADWENDHVVVFEVVLDDPQGEEANGDG